MRRALRSPRRRAGRRRSPSPTVPRRSLPPHGEAERALALEACRCARAIVAASGEVPPGAVVSWPCLGVSLACPRRDGALLLAVWGDGVLGAFSFLRAPVSDAGEIFEVDAVRRAGSAHALHRRVRCVARAVEEALDLRACVPRRD